MESALAAAGSMAFLTEMLARLVLCSGIPLGTPPAPPDAGKSSMPPPGIACAAPNSAAGPSEAVSVPDGKPHSTPPEKPPADEVLPPVPPAGPGTGCNVPLRKPAAALETRPDKGTGNLVSQIQFSGPEGMLVSWRVKLLGRQGYELGHLECPGRRDFPRGQTHLLELTNLPGPGRTAAEVDATLEVVKSCPRTEAFLAHNAIPVQFTTEDFDNALNSKPVTEVIYLPDPEFQELALLGVATLVSTRLEPGVDPIVEANRRGAIIAVVRLQPKNDKASLWRGKNHDWVPILGPLQAGTSCMAAEAPSEGEVLRALDKARPVQEGVAGFHKVQRKNARIVAERFAEYVDPPRSYPSIGPAQVHHVHFKCIVYYTEVTSVDGQNPHSVTTEDCQEVVYIDHDHLHMAGKPGP